MGATAPGRSSPNKTKKAVVQKAATPGKLVPNNKAKKAEAPEIVVKLGPRYKAFPKLTANGVRNILGLRAGALKAAFLAYRVGVHRNQMAEANRVAKAMYNQSKRLLKAALRQAADVPKVAVVKKSTPKKASKPATDESA